MANLVYAVISASLDGYVEDEDGNFDWAAPDEEVHAFINDLERPIGTYLYGRRLYEVMAYWETARTATTSRQSSGTTRQIWQAADKIVYSHDARGGLQREDADRAGVRTRSGRTDEGVR